MIYCLRPGGKFIKLADFLGARVAFDRDAFNLDARLPAGTAGDASTCVRERLARNQDSAKKQVRANICR